MRDMTADERRAFLMEGTRTAKLATVRADGRPHIAPIWFVLDGDDVLFNTGKTTVKGKNILREKRLVLCVDDDRPPFAYVVVEGDVEISEDPAELVRWATAIGGRYMGQENAEQFGKRNGVPGELLVRVRSTKIIAHDGISD